MKVCLIKNGALKDAPAGFSWTTLFFGFIPAFLRGDIKWGIIMLLVALITGGLSWLVFPFIYNKIYIKSLIAAGYLPRDNEAEEFLRRKGIYDGDLLDNVVSSVSNLGQRNGDKGGDPAEELRKWRDLYNDGAITEAEYERKKREILERS